MTLVLTTYNLLASAQNQPHPHGYISEGGFVGYRPDNHPHAGLKPDASTLSRLRATAEAVAKVMQGVGK